MATSSYVVCSVCGGDVDDPQIVWQGPGWGSPARCVGSWHAGVREGGYEVKSPTERRKIAERRRIRRAAKQEAVR